MPWLTLTVTASEQQAEILSNALLELGALSVDVHDADAGTPDEQAIFGEPGEAPPRHGAVESSGAPARSTPVEAPSHCDDPSATGGAAGRLLPQSAGFAITSDLASIVGSSSRMASCFTSNVSQPPPHLWPHNRVTALFAEDARIDAIMLEAAHAIGLEQPPAYHTEILADNDWVRLTQSQFDPIRISQRLWIVPTWHTPSDPAAINIVLDPGLAFGTGSHPTTRLCLRWLDANIQGGESVLDYGCGSGILAIVALKLGAARATGVDVDAQAVQSSRDNAAANRVTAEFYLPDATPQLQADIVVANILTNPLKLLAPLLAAATRQGGRIVLSGILADQAEDVMKIYAQWYNLEPPIMEEGWASLSGVKR